MRPPLRLAFILALTFGCAGCGLSNRTYSYQDVTVTVSPGLTSLPVNATQQFTSTVANAPGPPSWSATTGTVTSTGFYTAPATPPVFTQDELQKGATQGVVTVSASVYWVDETITAHYVTGFQSFIITAPSVTAGITPATATVPLGTTLQLTPYAVGSTNLAYTLQVGGVTGGNMSLGTISTLGVYTAPATMPMTGPTVVITVISQADPTKTATATITLQ